MTLPHDPTEQQSKCPLCDQLSATFIPLDFGRKRKYSCPICIGFIVSPSDEEDLLNLKSKERDAISKKARECDDKTILLIYTERISTQGKLPVQYNTVKTTYEPKCNWL